MHYFDSEYLFCTYRKTILEISSYNAMEWTQIIHGLLEESLVIAPLIQLYMREQDKQ